jgi:type II secretory pathway predicted ATPase ExeA
MAASLYSKHFALRAAPFPLTPDSDVFFSGGTRKGSFDALVHVLLEERGIVKLVGDAGTGKTTMCRQLSRALSEHFTVLYTCDPSLADEQTLFALADALRLSVTRREGAAAVAAEVRRSLGALYDGGRPVLLMIDEAHALPVDTLEQLRLLSQRDTGDETMRLMLIGPDDLDHKLATPAMEALRTRIAHSIRLKRLKLQDIEEYLEFRMERAGWEGERVFSPNAVRGLAKLSGGIPRRLNVLADKSLLSAALDKRHVVNGRDVARGAEEIKLARRRGAGAGAGGWGFAIGALGGGVAAAGLIGGIALASGWLGSSEPAGVATPQPPKQGPTMSPTQTPAASGTIAPPAQPAPPAVSPAESGPLSPASTTPGRGGGAPLRSELAPAPPAGVTSAELPDPLADPRMRSMPAPQFVQDLRPPENKR